MQQLPKAKAGVHGLDEITNGGFALGRSTLLCNFKEMLRAVHGAENFFVSGSESEFTYQISETTTSP